MKTTMMTIRFMLACAAASGALSVQAADVDVNGNVGYAVDQRGMIARSGTGLCWRAGYWSPAMAVVACDPDLMPKTSPVPAAPAAATSVAAPVPPAPAAAKTCNFTATLQNDETFAFNQSSLTGAAKARLDGDVLRKLAGCASVDLILVTGHADRLGGHPYNQKLSERRAQVVLDYLLANGANAKQTETMGAGKTQPAKGCDDRLSRGQLIACLAPNRRVVIEVKGPAR